MPTALELLSTEACDDILVVDLESRTIIIPKNVSVLGVEADDETRILHFSVPRHYCEVDLSEFSIRINYKNAKGEGDLYIVTDAVIEDDLIKFDWVVGRHAFTKKGNVVFNVCLKDVFEGIVRREFNTTVAILPVLEGLETGEEIVEEYLDIFEQMREELTSDLGTLATTAVNEYITEHADEIKGPKGDAFTYEDFTPEQLESLKGAKGDAFTYEDFTAEQLESLKGPQGDPFEYEDFTAEQLAKLVGPAGSSIQSITRTSGTGAPGTTDTYTVTLTDGSTTTFSVYNGKDGPAGSGAGDMLASMYDPQGKKQDIFQYVDDAVANMDLPDDIGDMQASTYDPQGKKQDIFKYVDVKLGDGFIDTARGVLIEMDSSYDAPIAKAISEDGSKINAIKVWGKNWFHRDNTSSVSNIGITVDWDEETQEFVFNGTTTAGGDLKLCEPLKLDWIAGEKYAISVRHTGGTASLASGSSGTTFAWGIFQSNASKYVHGSTSLTAFPELYNFTATAFALDDTRYYILYFQCWRPGTVFTDYRVKLQIEQGDEYTEWEPSRYASVSPEDVGALTLKQGKNFIVADPAIEIEISYGTDVKNYIETIMSNIELPDTSGIPNLGENITEGYANDTVAFWATKGSGQAWFSSNEMLVNQPSQYGFVISYTNGADAFQMFSDQTNGVTYFRYGDNVNNWFKHWAKVYDDTCDIGGSGFPNLGENVTESSTNDTIAFWADKGSGQAWFSAMNMLIDQPSEYGILINYAHTTEIFQIFRRMPDGPAYWRSGNVNGWNGSWAKVYDSHTSNINVEAVNAWGTVSASSDESSMTMYTNGIGDGNGNVWIDQAGDAWFKEIHIGSGDNYKEVATKDDIANLGGSTFYEATIGTSWTENEDTGVKSQTVAISGVTASKNAHVEPRYTGDGTSEGYAAFVEQKNQFFTCITNGYAETVADGITFHIFGDAPTVSIPVLVEVQ